MVLSVEVVEDAFDAAAHQLEGAVREQARLDNQSDHGLGEKGRRGGGLDDGGNAGEECRGQLLQHSPDGEVEGVDLNGYAVSGSGHMGGEEGAVTGQDLGFAV